MFVPFTPDQCAIVMVLIATIYTVISGFYGVVYTDIFQSCIILIVVVVVSVMAFNKVADYETLAAVAEKVTGTTEWMTYHPQVRTTMPTGGEYQQYEYLLLFAAFYLIRNLLAGTGAGAAPMYFGARSDRACGKLAFLWGNLMMTRWIMMIGFAVLGLYLVNDLFDGGSAQLGTATEIVKDHLGDVDKSLWANQVAKIGQSPDQFAPELIAALKENLGENWDQKLQLVGYEGTVNPERILPAVVLFCIPAGMRGLIIITLIAAFMSHL